MVLSAVNRCRMMVFRDVVSRCEERGAKARRDDFEPIVNCKKTHPKRPFSGNRDYLKRQDYLAKSIAWLLFTADEL